MNITLKLYSAFRVCALVYYTVSYYSQSPVRSNNVFSKTSDAILFNNMLREIFSTWSCLCYVGFFGTESNLCPVIYSSFIYAFARYSNEMIVEQAILLEYIDLEYDRNDHITASQHQNNLKDYSQTIKAIEDKLFDRPKELRAIEYFLLCGQRSLMKRLWSGSESLCFSVLMCVMQYSCDVLLQRDKNLYASFVNYSIAMGSAIMLIVELFTCYKEQQYLL